jgi:hypothetical protein
LTEKSEILAIAQRFEKPTQKKLGDLHNGPADDNSDSKPFGYGIFNAFYIANVQIFYK